MTASAAAAPLAAPADKDPIYTLTELDAMGFGHPVTIRRRIHSLDVPVEVLDGRGTFGVRESNLHMLQIPVYRSIVPKLPTHDSDGAQSAAPVVTSDDLDDLATLAARMVATWPRLSEERKRELGALLATP